MIKSITDVSFVKEYIESHRNLFLDNLILISDMDVFAEKITKLGEVFVFFDSNQSPRGLIAGYMNDFKTKKSYISLLFVDVDYGNKGVATQLIKHFEKKSIEKGMSSIEVRTIKANNIAIYLYLKNKFIVNKEISNNRFLLLKKL
ncbi:GNAT family N-acetyltransferase [Enterococcus casseliflavus]|uniref:GNAT family N-acetyltransferase n=1 Tax=Enterococcus casseliflavus TaxID=37734 RepID=UPI003D118D6C